MDPSVSSRVAWALTTLGLDFHARQEIAAQVGKAKTFDDLPAATQGLVRRVEQDAPPAQEWRRTGRWQLTHDDVKAMSAAGIDAARQQGHLRLLMAGTQSGFRPTR